MLRKIVLVCLISGMLPCFAHSEIDAGLRIGLGTHIGRDDPRIPLVVGVDGVAKLLKRNNLWFGVRMDGELSYWEYTVVYGNEPAAAGHADPWGLRLLLDLSPEVGLALGKSIKPGLGVGFTLGSRKEEGLAYKSKSSLFGFNVRSYLTYENGPFFDKFTLKYRYLAENLDLEYEGVWQYQGLTSYVPLPEKYNHQSLDIVLSTGRRIGIIALEAGLHVENWIHKDEYNEEWSGWSDEREFIIFGKVGASF